MCSEKFEEKKQWLRKMIGNLLDKIVSGSSEKIIFANQGKNWGKDIPMVEVKVESRDFAFKIRNTFVEKKKGGVDFGKIHIANSVCLATRVRVDILRVIARQFTVEGGEEMYVSAYNSRPVLHITDKTGGRKPFALTFADAITRFGDMLKEESLGEAYRRAGSSFRGQLEQHFVVLKENQQVTSQYPVLETTGQAKKQPLEDQNSAFGRNSDGGRGRGTRGGRGDWRSKMPRKLN